MEIPEDWRVRGFPRRGYKFLAVALEERLGWLAWRGLDQRQDDAAILRRVAQIVMMERWYVSADEQGVYDRLRAQLERLLILYPEKWDPDSGRYMVHVQIREWREGLESMPRFRDLVVRAREQLANEHGEHCRREAQLRKETAGQSPLHARLRDLARNARERGDLAESDDRRGGRRTPADE